MSQSRSHDVVLLLLLLLEPIGFAVPVEPKHTISHSNCPTGWVNAHSDGCFKFLPEEGSMGWFEAQLSCEKIGGFLAEPSSDHQMEFLSGLAAVVESFTSIRKWWIGLTDISHEGVWNWQHTGKVCTTEFWADETSSVSNVTYNRQDCAFMELDSGQLKWKDFECLQMSDGKSVDEIAPLCQREVDLTKNQALECYEGWSEFNNSCFKFIEEKHQWQEAREVCQTKSSDLASIHSIDEYKFVLNLTLNMNELLYVWLGGHDLLNEGGWEWSDGTQWDYELEQFTQDGMEKQNCLAFDLQPSGLENISYWLDKGCYMEYSAVCRSEKFLVT